MEEYVGALFEVLVVLLMGCSTAYTRVGKICVKVMGRKRQFGGLFSASYSGRIVGSVMVRVRWYLRSNRHASKHSCSKDKSGMDR